MSDAQLSGFLHVFMTGERITPESAEQGDAAERGWVDPQFSTHEFFDSRNDAGSVLSVPLSDPDLTGQIVDALQFYLGGWEDNGDGTFYSTGDGVDYATGDSYRYALHFVRKFYDGRQYREEPYAPVIRCERSTIHGGEEWCETHGTSWPCNS